MTRLIRRTAVAALLAAVPSLGGLCLAGSPAQARSGPCTPRAGVVGGQLDWLVCGVPDLDQRREALPNTGRNHCVPTSIVNALADLTQRGAKGTGLPNLDWQAQSSFAQATDAISQLGVALGTTGTGGTTGDTGGLAKRLDMIEAVASKYVSVGSDAWVTDPADLLMRGMTGDYVFPNTTFVNKSTAKIADETFVPVITTGGGHVMTAVGGRTAADGSRQLYVNDPATDWVLDAVQSEFRSDVHTLRLKTFQIDSGDRTEKKGAYNYFYDTVEDIQRWTWDDDNTLLWGYFSIGREAAWVTIGKKLRVIRPDPLAPVAATIPETFSLPGGTPVDVALTAASAQPLVVTRRGGAVFQVNPVTGQVTTFAKLPGVTAITVGGPDQTVFATSGKRLLSFSGRGEKLATRKLAQPLSALEYDTAKNRVVGLTKDGRELRRFTPALKPVGKRSVSGGVAAGLAVSPAGKVTLASLKLGKLADQGKAKSVAIAGDGHLLVAQGGRLREYTAGGRKVKGSAFNGLKATRVLALTRSYDGGAPLAATPRLGVAPFLETPADLVGVIDGNDLVVRNQGGTAAGAFRVQTTTGIGNTDVPGLAAGAELRIPVGCHGEDTATIDVLGQVAESDEANNVVVWECHE